MDDIKSGKYSKFLVQPLGYFPYRLCSYFGQKLPGQAMIIIILVLVLLGLNLFWGVTPGLFQILGFLLALALAVVLNFLIFYCISSISFWIVEIGFLFEGIRITTVLLSGGIFPLEVFGPQFLAAMKLLPFMYTVNYPINVLNGKLSPAEVGQGLLMQCIWIGGCALLSNLLWRMGSRRYVAVGG
jgi:ABC-2 type transport system permease protein